MLIKGLQKTTLVDFPGKIAATIFTAGCNFRCGFCHNAALVDEKAGAALPTISVTEVLDYLKTRVKQLEGVCISGGEPTRCPDLPEFIRALKNIGYAVKLDTNGTNPQLLQELFAAKLLYYVAMDIKGPPSLYARIVNAAVDMAKITQSVRLIMDSNVPYEFRTTALPAFLNEQNFTEVADLIKGARCYYLQQFHCGAALVDPASRAASVYSAGQLRALARLFAPYVQKMAVRGL